MIVCVLRMYIYIFITHNVWIIYTTTDWESAVITGHIPRSTNIDIRTSCSYHIHTINHDDATMKFLLDKRQKSVIGQPLQRARKVGLFKETNIHGLEVKE